MGREKAPESSGSDPRCDGDGERDDSRDAPSADRGDAPPDECEESVDPTTYLPEDLSLDEFEQVVDGNSTILEVQQETRLPRWKVKRLLHHTDMRDRVDSTAQRVASLRDTD